MLESAQFTGTLFECILHMCINLLRCRNRLVSLNSLKILKNYQIKLIDFYFVVNRNSGCCIFFRYHPEIHFTLIFDISIFDIKFLKNVLAPKKSFSKADFYERDHFSHYLERIKYCLLELRNYHKIFNKYF